jgi:hypothetical protein
MISQVFGFVPQFPKFKLQELGTGVCCSLFGLPRAAQAWHMVSTKGDFTECSRRVLLKESVKVVAMRVRNGVFPVEAPAGGGAGSGERENLCPAPTYWSSAQP